MVNGHFKRERYAGEAHIPIKNIQWVELVRGFFGGWIVKIHLVDTVLNHRFDTEFKARAVYDDIVDKLTKLSGEGKWQE